MVIIPVYIRFMDNSDGGAMSQELIEKVLGRLLTDDHFRQRAALNLEEVCQQEGFSLSDEEMRLVRQSDFRSLATAADGLDSSIRRFAVKCDNLP